MSDLVDMQAGESDVLLIVTDAQGRILAHPNRDRLLQSLATEPRLSAAFRRWLADGSVVEPSGLRLAQPAEVVSAAGVAGPDWMIWRATPEAELLAPLRSARKQAPGWAAGLVGLMSVLMLTLLWWLLRPLNQLEHRAQNLFDGDGDPHAGWPVGLGEIGRLARVLRHVGAERAQLEGFNAAVLGKLNSVMAAAPVGIAFMRAERFELVSAERRSVARTTLPCALPRTVRSLAISARSARRRSYAVDIEQWLVSCSPIRGHRRDIPGRGCRETQAARSGVCLE